MNKDSDERIVPPGQYRDATNIQVATSDGSDVGTAQAVLGNIDVSSNMVPDGYSKCVGSIAKPESDLIYYFIYAGGNSLNKNAPKPSILKDYIIEYNTIDKTSKYVFVDIYGASVLCTRDAHGTADHLHVDELTTASYNVTGIRVGMLIYGTFTNTTGGSITHPTSPGTTITNNSTYIISPTDGVVVRDIQIDSGSPAGWRIYGSVNITHTTGDLVQFQAPRVLRFDPNNFIPAINILDDMIFWTDNRNEPRKVNITRSIHGTGGLEYLMGGGIAGYSNGTPTDSTAQNIANNNDFFHTRLVTKEDFVYRVCTNSGENKARWIEEEDITVIRKNPSMPLELDMSTTALSRETSLGVANPIFASLTGVAFHDGTDPFQVGDNITVTFDSVIDLREGDILIFVVNDVANDPSNFPTEDAIVRALVTSGNAGGPANGGVTGPYNIEMQAVDQINVGSGTVNWYCRLEQEKPLFEYKFPRFSYRWRYVDGEYSTFAPWSEVAFLPGDFDYLPKKGFNLGMTNNLRSLKLKRYFQEYSNVPGDVVGVELLYKETNSPTVYTVKELTKADGDPLWPDSKANFHSRGVYEISSELIHAVVPANQLLRPWDNVPRIARAQEVTANRLVYGNYTQNYNIDERVEIEASYSSTNIDNTGNVEGIETPTLSCKSLRTYQIGVVFSDYFGRETPVQVPKSGGSVTIPKGACIKSNQLKAQLKSDPPVWAEKMKWYIKETSNEFYNVAMDRFYDAEDGNVWISFPSSERNKVDINTYLILKKQHDNQTAVLDRARYKAIAVENEPPTFIKKNRKSYGMAQVDYTSAGKPEIDKSFIIVRRSDFEANFENAIKSDDLELRIGGVEGGQVFTSNFYDIAGIALGSGTWSKITIKGKFEQDVSFAATMNANTEIKLEIVENQIKHKPEFDGRFFVKILKDLVLENELLTTFSESVTYAVIDTMQVGFKNDHGDGSPSDPNDGTGHDGSYESHWLSWRNSHQGDQYSNNNRWFYDDESSEASNNLVGKQRGGFSTWGGHTYMDISYANFNHGGGASSQGTRFTVPYDRLRNIGGLIRWKQDPTSTIYEIGGFRGRIASTAGIGMTHPSGGESGSSSSPLIGGAGDTKWNYHNSSTDDDNQRIGFRVKLDSFAFGLAPDYTAPGPAIMGHGGIDVDTTSGNGGVAHTWNPLANMKTTFNGLDGANELYTMPTYTRNGGCWHYSTYATSWTMNGWTTGANCISTIEFLEPYIATDASGGQAYSSDNPAIWETEPKEDIGLDIYYEASGCIPINMNHRVNEELVPAGSTFKYGGVEHRVTAMNDLVMTYSPATVAATVIPDNTYLKFKRYDKSAIILYINKSGGAAVGDNSAGLYIGRNPVSHTGSAKPWRATHHMPFYLGWHNCWAWGNGIESDRIRDDFNAPQLDNGVKASTTLAEKYETEVRGSGFIWSGIYNSTSGVNRLNQFIQAEPITKDLNPDHGTIQKLFTRNTDTLCFCEDKVLSISTNKDALYNADGSSNVSASNNVLGQAVPINGEFGISTNPMSFAATPQGAYWCDQMRGQVLTLSGKSVMSISDIGMKDYFNDNLRMPGDGSKIMYMVGTYDDKKNEYNLTFGTKMNNTQWTPASTTISYSEMVKGWTSFKSFTPEAGLSINNEYYTWKGGEMHQHHMEVNLAGSQHPRNNFYGSQYFSDFTVIFNDNPGSVKSFNTVNYEGTQAKITPFVTQSVTDAAGNTFTTGDNEYYNLIGRNGWYVDSMVSNLQTTGDLEFKDKEGKWFSVIKGELTNLNNLDEREFSTQGIGIANIVTGGDRDTGKMIFTIRDSSANGWD